MTHIMTPEEITALEHSMGEPFDVERVMKNESKKEKIGKEEVPDEAADEKIEESVMKKKKNGDEKRREKMLLGPSIRLPKSTNFSIESLHLAYNRVFGTKYSKGQMIEKILLDAIEANEELKKKYEKACKF